MQSNGKNRKPKFENREVKKQECARRGGADQGSNSRRIILGSVKRRGEEGHY
jgi:hypothetical protein